MPVGATSWLLMLLRYTRFHFALLCTLLSKLFVVVMSTCGTSFNVCVRRMQKILNKKFVWLISLGSAECNFCKYFFVALWLYGAPVRGEHVKQQQNLWRPSKICILKRMADVNNIFGVTDVSTACGVGVYDQTSVNTKENWY